MTHRTSLGVSGQPNRPTVEIATDDLALLYQLGRSLVAWMRLLEQQQELIIEPPAFRQEIDQTLARAAAALRAVGLEIAEGEHD